MAAVIERVETELYADALFDEAIPCMIRFPHRDGTIQPCPNEAAWDAFISCPVCNCERTRHYCDSCMMLANDGRIACHLCLESGMDYYDCGYIIVFASMKRNYK